MHLICRVQLHSIWWPIRSSVLAFISALKSLKEEKHLISERCDLCLHSCAHILFILIYKWCLIKGSMEENKSHLCYLSSEIFIQIPLSLTTEQTSHSWNYTSSQEETQIVLTAAECLILVMGLDLLLWKLLPPSHRWCCQITLSDYWS